MNCVHSVWLPVCRFIELCKLKKEARQKGTLHLLIDPIFGQERVVADAPALFLSLQTLFPANNMDRSADQYFQVPVRQPGSSKATRLHMPSSEGCPAQREAGHAWGQLIPLVLWVSSMCYMAVTWLKASLGAVSHDFIYYFYTHGCEMLPPGSEGWCWRGTWAGSEEQGFS